jgi:N6-L-threonylcarbamoyladenine synthase
LGETLDDAAGEAFDKSAKLLGLDYPGGALLSKLAERGTADRFKLPRPMLHSGDLDFSFSGLKTAVLVATQQNELNHQTKADIALAAQSAIVDVLVSKSLSALKQTGLNQLVIAGGVGANQALRMQLNLASQKRGFKVFYPDLEFCTDNGAMIAFAGAMRMKQNVPQRDYRFNVKPRWDLQQLNQLD